MAHIVVIKAKEGNHIFQQIWARKNSNVLADIYNVQCVTRRIDIIGLSVFEMTPG